MHSSTQLIVKKRSFMHACNNRKLHQLISKTTANRQQSMQYKHTTTILKLSKKP